MKTNKVMIRRMGSLEVNQRTQDGMFNATSLLKQWNSLSGKRREVTKYINSPNTKELIDVIKREENLSCDNSAYVKSRASKGENAGTWMHPVLFVDFAMWLNPKFKYHVIKFIYDQLIQFRIESGDQYIEMNKAMSERSLKQFGHKPAKDTFIREARRIRDALGVTDWETATELQLKFRKRLENVNIMAFKRDYFFEKRMMLFDFVVDEYKNELIHSAA